MRFKLSPMGRLAVAAVGLAATAWAPAASATRLIATFTGTVNYGFDTEGLFGAPGSSLDGESYVATYSIDTSNGVYYHSGPYSEPIYSEYVNFGVPSIASATLTINGVTVDIDGHESSTEEVLSGYLVGYFTQPYYIHSYSSSQNEYIGGKYTYGYVALQSLIYNNSLSAPGVSGFFTLDQPYSLQDVGLSGSFRIYVSNGDSSNPLELENVYGDLGGGGSVVVSTAADVPEPETWTLIVVGFGVLGAGLRRHRSPTPCLSS